MNKDETPIWKIQLPAGIYEYALKKFEEELSYLYYPELIVLPLTPEGEEEREWLINTQHDADGNMINQSILRYGCSEHNFEYEGDTFLAILVNND